MPGTLTGKFEKIDGTPAKGSVSIEANVPVIVDKAGNVVFSGVLRVPLVNGAFSVELPASDDLTLEPNGFTFNVAPDLAHAKVAPTGGVFVLDGQSIDLTDAVVADPAAPTYDELVLAAEIAAADADASADAALLSADAAAVERGIAQAAASQAAGSAVSASESASEAAQQVTDGLAAALAAGTFKGDRGDKGDKGDKGDQGIQGVKGDTGDGLGTHLAAADPHAQYARKSAINAFTTAQSISVTGTALSVINTAAPANTGRWGITPVNNGELVLNASDDNWVTNGTQFTIDRLSNFRVGNVRFNQGTGSPEGVLSAGVGSRYVDTAATNGAVEWIKASGTGNTGWKVTYGDTGWRDVMTLVDSTRWDTVNGTTQYAVMRRVNDTVSVLVKTKRTGTLGGGVGSATDGALFYISSGWQPYKYGQKAIATRNGQWASSAGSGFSAIAVIGGVATPNTWALNDAVEFNGTWLTDQAWPASLPGVAV